MKLPQSDDQVLLLHNPRCSKSRAVEEILTQQGIAFEGRTYLDDPLTAEELGELETRLGKPIGDWVRRNEGAWAEVETDARGERADVIAAVSSHPILMERPIVVRGAQARVGRPPHDVLELFD